MKSVALKIDYQETGLHRINLLTERFRYNWFSPDEWQWYKVIFASAYQICNAYTQKNRVVEVLKKLTGSEATKHVIYDLDGKIVSRHLWKKILKNIHYNDAYNCHGFAFFDSQFWFPPNIEYINMILDDNNYQACDLASLKDKGVGLYFDTNGKVIHSSKMVGTDLQSKFGITSRITHGEKQIMNLYQNLNIDPSRTRYYNLVTQ